MASLPNTSGRLILAGAGPGDPELITLKTARYLGQADVVLTDRLVSPEILDTYVNAKATVIHVGKQCRHGHSTPQQTINELIVHYAKLGKLVVRLKGGDVSIFSNVLDELETAHSHHIPYEIVPGITAAMGAASYSGIPLTARGFSTAVRFLTCYKSDVLSESYWKELAESSDTLVFYMSSETLDILVDHLRDQLIDPGKLMAVIEQATTPNQSVEIFNLYEYAARHKGRKFISPSLVIIGKVVALHDTFSWFSAHSPGIPYFRATSPQDLEGILKKQIPADA
jgi:uroporphyrin-III C-methyltransferase